MLPFAPAPGLDADAISGICGSISIACWVVVFSPQIIQQFRRGNADGLSIRFISIWLLGDVFNVTGALLQGVLPTMTILAIYYTLADIVLLGQCFFYRGFTWRDEPASPEPASTPKPRNGEPGERTTLLTGDIPSEPRASDWTALSPAVAHVSEATEPHAHPGALQSAAWNATIVATVCAAGVFGWLLGKRATNDGHGAPDPEQGADDRLELNVPGQVFGYLCTVAYIASRIPQLLLNWRRKTTDGLSMLFFLFACLGNVTYVLLIAAYDPKCGGAACTPSEARRKYGRYILVNLSWLAGSLVTLLMDLTVFAQYFIYQARERREADTRNARGSASDGHWDRPLLERSDTSN